MRKLLSIISLCVCLSGCFGALPNPNQTALMVNIVAQELLDEYKSEQIKCLETKPSDEEKRSCVLHVQEDWKPVWLAFDLLRETKDAKDTQVAWCAFLNVLKNHNVKLVAVAELIKSC